MIFPEEFLNMVKESDEQLISKIRSGHIIYRKNFLELSIGELKSLDEASFFLTIDHHYSNLCLFPDDEVLEKFRQIGLSKFFTKWFVSLEEILNEFDKIEIKGVIIFRGPALALIKLHLDSKIKNELIQWGDYVTLHRGNPETNMLVKTFHDITRLEKTARKKPIKYKDEYTELMHELAKNFKKEMPENINSQKMLTDLAQGKTEYYYLRQMIESALIKPQRLSNRKFFILVYDLFKLIIKEYEMLSSDQFFEKELTTSFETYRYRKIQQILYRK